MADGKNQTPERVEIDATELETLLSKAAEVLEPSEIEKLRRVVETLRFVTDELEKKRVSVKRLQRMLFGSNSEKQSSPRLRKLLEQVAQAQGASSPSSGTEEDDEVGSDAGHASRGVAFGIDREGKKAGHGRRAACEYSGGEHVHVSHPTIKPKDPCPKCPKGRLYKQKTPKVLVRLTGTAPVQAKVWSYDWFRCNLCGYIVNAPLPEAAGPPEKYDESVTSTVGILRYGYGMPLNRLAQLQESHRIPLPASTQWQLLDASASVLAPVFTERIRQATRGDVLYNDDTTARVLELMAARRKERPAKEKNNERVGTFTTGVISTLAEQKIALYLTGTNHAGENLTDVLAMCEGPRGSLVQMSDGLSHNEPSHLPDGLAVIHANCLANGRRKYVEIAESFPEQCLQVIGVLEVVYKNDATTRREKMSAADRLAYHQAHSAEVMEDLKLWLEQQLEEKLVEPNSSFGQATKYMLERWGPLTRFLTVPCAPLDNNICERALKKAIRHRKNSLFYKTLHGARVGDIYMSLIHTSELNGINPFDYIKSLLTHPERVARAPEVWMPWNYAADEKAATAS